MIFLSAHTFVGECSCSATVSKTRKKKHGNSSQNRFFVRRNCFCLRNSGIKWEELRRSTAVVFFFSFSFFRRVCSLCLIILPVKIKHLRRYVFACVPAMKLALSKYFGTTEKH